MHVASDRIPETNSQVNASKIIVATDDTARGLVQLVDDHGVTELVMGAASDRAYTRYSRSSFVCLGADIIQRFSCSIACSSFVSLLLLACLNSVSQIYAIIIHPC